ncbi:hypothetical protein A2U01_0043349, partial [Trifolium medium]|nr:hypothetical protein [Trifolium medium]
MRLKVGEDFEDGDEGARDKGAKVGRNRVGNNEEGEKSVRRREGRVENTGIKEARKVREEEVEGMGFRVGEVESTKLVRTYTSHTDDYTWAAQGVVATVINGE